MSSRLKKGSCGLWGAPFLDIFFFWLVGGDLAPTRFLNSEVSQHELISGFLPKTGRATQIKETSSQKGGSGQPRMGQLYHIHYKPEPSLLPPDTGLPFDLIQFLCFIT